MNKSKIIIDTASVYMLGGGDGDARGNVRMFLGTCIQYLKGKKRLRGQVLYQFMIYQLISLEFEITVRVFLLNICTYCMWLFF